MTLEEFKALAAAWGSDMERWPEHLRAYAAITVRTHDAVAVLAEAEQIDQLIITARPEIADDRIACNTRRRP